MNRRSSLIVMNREAEDRLLRKHSDEPDDAPEPPPDAAPPRAHDAPLPPSIPVAIAR
jgi:hypothetical protein